MTIAYPKCKRSAATIVTRANNNGILIFEVSWKKFFFRIIKRFEKSGVKLQCVTGEGKLDLVQIIGNLK